MAYKHGPYGEIVPSVAKAAVQSQTTLVTIGTAPINLVRGYSDKGLINEPVLLEHNIDAQNKIGASADWNAFSICETVAAHFDNPLGNVGPIVVINVLDPELHRQAQTTEVTLNFVNGKANIISDKIILDTFALDEKAEGLDYVLDYDFERGALIVRSADKESPLSGDINATYNEVDPTAVSVDDIIGSATEEGAYSGLGVVELVYQKLFAIPNILTAPHWSEIPEVYNALVSVAQNINGHWNAFVLADIPIEVIVPGENPVVIDTIAKAIAWKDGNGYLSDYSKSCWPKGKDGQGRIFNVSTLTGAVMLAVDLSHGGIPMETPSNKQTPIIEQYFGASSTNRGFDQRTANTLNAEGITTICSWASRWVIWGPHTSAYAYGKDIDGRGIFDVTMRMLEYVTNGFQSRHGLEIDTPMTKQLKDSILFTEQQELDSLASIEALVGDPTIEFLSSSNPAQGLAEGDFTWEIQETATPPAKSLTARAAHTDAGYSVFYGGEQR